MKNILSLLYILFFVHTAQAQQLKRATLSSTGTQNMASPARMSWTVGSSCIGCGTLKTDKGFVRQGFQQPPEIENNPPGCLITAQFDVNVVSTPLCGSKFDFEFTGVQSSGMTIEWGFGEDAFPALSSQTNPMGIGYLTPGNKVVTLTVKKDGCLSTSAKVINILPNQITFGGVADVSPAKCFGESSGAIAINTYGGKGFKTFKWSNGSTTSAIANLPIGNYSVTVTDANNCAFTIDTVIKQPLKSLSVTEMIIGESCKDYKDGSINIVAAGGTSPYKYEWSNGKTSAFNDSLSAGKYKLRVIDAHNCLLDTSYAINIRCRDNTNDKIYDTFTPNGDNINDTWIIKDILQYPNNEVIIYNRWGQLVYTQTGYANEWAGLTNDGKELPTAAYYYVIKLNDDKGTIWTGTVTLVR